MVAKAYKITSTIYAKYEALLAKNYSKAAACRELKIAPSTMYDYAKRLAKEAKHEYFVIRRGAGVGVAVSEKIFTFDYKSDFYKKNKTFIDSLASRDVYFLNDTELKLIESSIINKDVAKVIEKAGKLLEIRRGKAYYKNFEISRELFDLIKVAMEKSQKSNHILKFAELMVQNPDRDIIRQLYPFLKHNDIEICNNGYILAYKSIRNNFTDHHTGKFDNSVGKYVEMDRKDVVKDPSKTCEAGLHVGSLSYIRKIYGSGIIVKCIVHPRDFVSIPTDYDGAKARVCKYKVASVHDK